MYSLSPSRGQDDNSPSRGRRRLFILLPLWGEIENDTPLPRGRMTVYRPPCRGKRDVFPSLSPSRGEDCLSSSLSGGEIEKTPIFLPG